MEPGSRAENSLERTSLKLADVIGTLIALLTLVMPLVAIANFSSIDPPSFIPPPANVR